MICKCTEKKEPQYEDVVNNNYFIFHMLLTLEVISNQSDTIKIKLI